MKIIKIMLNFIWTFFGIIGGIVSIPSEISFHLQPPAIIFKVKSFWWYSWLLPGIRAMAIGNIVLLGPKTLNNDLEHELIHVEQAMRAPLVHPLLYTLENLKKGYKNNKYEIEAYSKSNSTYIK